jgi:hypothetical protein
MRAEEIASSAISSSIAPAKSENDGKKTKRAEDRVSG